MTSIADDLQAAVDAEAAVEGAACLLRVELPGTGVWRHVAGGLSRGGEPAQVDSPFRIASVTKTLTATVVTQLAAEGLLGLDDLMAQHLPDTYLDLVDRVHVLDGVSYGATITVRQLLTHASGLFDYAMSPSYGAALFADPGHVWTPREMIEGAIAWGTPHFPPGGGYGYAYSDTGYVLLGVIIEHLDGRSLHEAYRARIIEPLGMATSYLEGFEPHRGSPIAHSHEGSFDVSVLHGSSDWAGGGLVSTTDDLARFAQGLLGLPGAPGRLLDERWLDEMLDYRFRTLDPALHSPGYLGYGFGLEARERTGVVLRGHRGHWGVIMSLDPASGLTITGTINQSSRRPDALFDAAVDAFVSRGLVPSGPVAS